MEVRGSRNAISISVAPFYSFGYTSRPSVLFQLSIFHCCFLVLRYEELPFT